jgi:hypothetical protein
VSPERSVSPGLAAKTSGVADYVNDDSEGQS